MRMADKGGKIMGREESNQRGEERREGVQRGERSSYRGELSSLGETKDQLPLTSLPSLPSLPPFPPTLPPPHHYLPSSYLTSSPLSGYLLILLPLLSPSLRHSHTRSSDFRVLHAPPSLTSPSLPSSQPVPSPSQSS